jgi:predicted transcriptional regulator
VEQGQPVTALSITRVKESVEKARSSLKTSAEEVVWQIENETWTVLGYSDWKAMREAEYGGPAFMVPTAVRGEYVHRLRDFHLTQREIAATMGIGAQTVNRCLKMEHVSNETDESSAPAVREGITEWSRRVETVSAECPMGSLSVEEIRELQGAATYLRNYCEGELVGRNEA